MIAFKRIENEYTDERLMSVGFDVVYYKDIKFRDGVPLHDRVDIAGDKLWYFRAVGTEMGMVSALLRYGKGHDHIMIDDYLVEHGPMVRSKWIQYNTLNDAGITVPHTIKYESFDRVRFPQIPCVLRASTGGRRGLYTFLVRDAYDKDAIYDTIVNREDGYNTVSGKEWLVSDYIPNNGDYRAFVVGDRCVGMYKRRPKDNLDGVTMNTSDGKSRRYRGNRWPTDVADVAISAAMELGVTVAGVDLVRHNDTGEIYVIEVNEAPSFKVMEMRTKLNIAQEIANELSRR